MNYQGGCHCGRIKNEVEGTVGQVIDCNCSMCRKRGGLLWFVPRTQFKLLTSETAPATYTFNTHKLHHRFCTDCGIAPFSEGTDPTDVATVCINVRCLEDVDPATLTVVSYDGRSR